MVDIAVSTGANPATDALPFGAMFTTGDGGAERDVQVE